MTRRESDREVERVVHGADTMGMGSAAAPGTGRAADELIDDDLEHVIGGLARAWMDGSHVRLGIEATAHAPGA